MKYIFGTVIISVFFMLHSLFVNGQNRIVFEQLTTKDGLSNGTVNSIFKDSKGFMWFCTDDGLCRYDGYNYKIYKSEKSSSRSTVNLQFHSIVEDTFGHIWVGTSFGLYFYDQNNDRILPFSAYSDLQVENNQIVSPISCLLVDSNQFLWVGSYTGITRIKITNPDIQNIKPEDIEFFNISSNDSSKLSSNVIFSLYEDSRHQIWVSSNSDQLDCYNYEENKFVPYKIEIPDFEINQFLGLRICADKNDDFWIASQGYGLIYWERKKMKFTQYKSLKNDTNNIDIRVVRSVLVDDLNRIWIGTDGNGLVIFNTKTDEIKHFRKNIEDRSNLSSNAIYSMYHDSSGIFWIGTYLMGLNKFVSNKSNFGQINSSPYSKTGLSHNLVTGFCEDKNKQIWISTDGGGLNLYDRNTDQFKQFKNDPADPSSISSNTAMALFCDRNNAIWVGSYNGGLNKFDPKTQKFQHFWHVQNDSTSISSNHPWSFAQDKWDNMWVATVDAGLNLIKTGSSTFIHYENNNLGNNSYNQLYTNSITQLFIDSKNYLWIGTEFGLDRVDLNQVDFSLSKPKLKFDHYLPNDTANSISSNRISCINEDGLGNIWIGTKGSGLNKLDLKTGKFTWYTVEDGLPHSIINGILFDHDNNLWISTNNGLSFFNIKSGKFKNYGISDGLQSSVFLKTSCLKTSDGLFLFGGINGFNAFYPDQITSKNIELKPYITDFKLNNQIVSAGDIINTRIILTHPIYELDELNLIYKENSFSFEFSALEFSNPEKVYYSYKLEGFDEDWQITDAKIRIAKYTNLSPGEYILHIKASTNDEDWPDSETTLRINILPPWWKTLWFRIIAVLSIIAFWIAVFSVRVYRLEKQKYLLKSKIEEKTRQLKEKNEQLDELNKSKDKFFSIIAHDIKNPFNAILGFSELLEDNFHDWSDEKKLEAIDQIHNSSENLYQLLENLLQWSRSQSGKIEFKPQKLDIKDSLQQVIDLMKDSAQAKNINLELKGTENDSTVFADLQMLNTIMRNLISNAIKFTETGGKIVVQIENNLETDKTTNTKFVRINVMDTGVGMRKEIAENLFRIDFNHSTKGTKNESGTGLGLLLVKEFVSKNGGEIGVESSVGKGSTFYFTLPLASMQ